MTDVKQPRMLHRLKYLEEKINDALSVSLKNNVVGVKLKRGGNGLKKCFLVTSTDVS